MKLTVRPLAMSSGAEAWDVVDWSEFWKRYCEEAWAGVEYRPPLGQNSRRGVAQLGSIVEENYA